MHDKTLLMTLYKKLSDGEIDLEKFYKLLGRAVSETLAGNRASAWFFSGSLQDRLVCAMMYDRSGNQWSSGQEIHEDDCAPYFEEIRQAKELAIADAHNEPATACFNDLDFTPIGTYALLDIMIEVDGAASGIIRCERDGQSAWSSDDFIYLKQTAAMLALVKKKFG